MKQKLSLIIALLVIISSQAQNKNIGIGTNTPAPSAKLEVTSTNKGFLMPRMTYAQRKLIANPAMGLMIYCTDCALGEFQGFDGKNWVNMIGNPSSDFPAVKICDKVWSSKNLDGATYSDGTPIPEVQDATAWAALTTGAWCYYNNSTDSGAKYGKLYNWYAVAGIYDQASLNDPSLRKKLAPIGWHVPSDDEWSTISCTGGSLKSTTGWDNNGGTVPNGNGNNSTGFTALPGGQINGSSFGDATIYGYWWSGSSVDATSSFSRLITYFDEGIYQVPYANTSGFSVRLVKD